VKTLIIALLALGLAVMLGHLISDDPGFVVIGYRDKVVRTSFVFFTAALLVGIVVVYGLTRLVYQIFRLPKRWEHWTSEYRRRRSNKALGKGMVALAEGDFSRAEQLFSRGVDPELAPAAHYLGAAEAAQGLNAPARRDTYLKLAHDALPDAEAAIGIKGAEMQIENGQFEQARATLTHLAERHPDNKQVLGLLRKIYTECRDWDALLDLLPVLKRHRVYEKPELAEMEILVGEALLAKRYGSVRELEEIWARIPKGCREQPAVLVLYVEQLIGFGRGEEAEALLRKALSRSWDPRLVGVYGLVTGGDPSRQLDRAETWLATRGDDADLLLTLAQLSRRVELWGKARSYLERLIKIEPSPVAYRLLGETAEQMGDREAAVQYQREGLVLATAGRPAVEGSTGLSVRQAAHAVQPAQ
jgi:HemY protein